MEFRKEGAHFVVRMEKGEKIVEGLNKFLEEKQVKGGFFQAVGAVKNTLIGFFESDRKDYTWKSFPEEMELVSLLGTITETGVHAHILVCDSDFACHGGHLMEAEVAITVELFLTELKKIRRKEDHATGLKLMEL
ncbi:MAG TPA: PPC domain-containing DNA-binding protein [Candidatus Norongarragalinales archaeon]|nr:PPC domain-containing DNA-binding protein [Candidatus Norongarragalinales archaeon]